MSKIAFWVIIMTLVSFSGAYAEGLDTLIKVGRSMADISSAYDGETKSFNRVKSAVDDGDIKKGMAKEDIRRRYGDPVIANNDSVTNSEKWVYKPAGSTFFKGIRIYLYFDDKGLLDEIKTLS